MRKIEPKILLLPVHRSIMKSVSEGKWALNIMEDVNASFEGVVNVVGEVDEAVVRNLRLSESSSLITLHNGINYSIKSDLVFYGKLFITGLRVLFSHEIDIIHHVMPLGVGSGFNPVFIVTRRPKKVVGPILYPYSTPDAKNFFEGYGIRYNRLHVNAFKPLFTILFILTIRSSDAVIVDSVETLKIIETMYPKVKGKKVHILPGGGQDKEIFTPFNQEGDLDHYTLGVLSYHTKNKNIDTILKALSKSRLLNVQLKIGGAGPQTQELKLLSNDLGIAERVKFLGELRAEDAPNFYHGVDVQIVAVLNPPTLNASIQEALMSGCAIIAPDLTSDSGHLLLPYGILVGDKSPEGFAKAIEVITSDRIKLAEMKRNARRFAEENLSTIAIRKKLEQIYVELFATK